MTGSVLHAGAVATVVELAPAASRNADYLSGALDITPYEGEGIFIFQSSVGTGTTPTLNAKLVHSDTAAGTYTDVTGGAFVEVTDGAPTAGAQALKINLSNLKGFVKLSGDHNGTTPAFVYGASLVAWKKYRG